MEEAVIVNEHGYIGKATVETSRPSTYLGHIERTACKKHASDGQLMVGL